MSTRGALSRRRLLAGVGGVAVAAATVGTLSSPAAARSTDTLIVNTAGSRLRSGPGTGYAVIASLPKGTEVRYLSLGGTANGYTWYQVKVLSTGKTGYIASTLVAAPGTGGGAPGFPANVIVNRGPLNMRSNPGLSYGVVATLSAGTKGWLTQRTFVKADGHTWAEVTFLVNGRYVTGHVSTAYVTIT